jgi:dTDP-4-dehydrorhamnose reductase
VRLYLTGADGMLGTALSDSLARDARTAAWRVTGVSAGDFDIADADALDASVRRCDPHVVVHCAAHAVLDDCAADPPMALRVNVRGTHNVAAVCRRLGRRMVYISSDYVFDGLAPPDGGYREDDVPDPVSLYGLTKLAGERITATVPDHLVVRTAWLFGGRDERTDVVLAAVGALLAGGRPRLIHDQFSNPTHTHDAARALVHLLAGAATGTVHAVSSGRASWHQVGELLVRLLRADGLDPGGRLGVDPVALADAGLVDARPVDSALSNAKLARLGHTMPHWTDAVRAMWAGLAARSHPSEREHLP